MEQNCNIEIPCECEKCTAKRRAFLDKIRKILDEDPESIMIVAITKSTGAEMSIVATAGGNYGHLAQGLSKMIKESPPIREIMIETLILSADKIISGKAEDSETKRKDPNIFNFKTPSGQA